MKWRLDEQHYDSDAMKVLEVGTVVGDGCENLWRYPEAAADKSLRGKPRPPSRSMTPLDDEAKKAWAEKFGDAEPPAHDPTKPIPITTIPRDAAGNIKTAQPKPPSTPPEFPPKFKPMPEPKSTAPTPTGKPQP